MFVSCVCCGVLSRCELLRRADHSFRGVLPVACAMCVCVCVCLLLINLNNAEPRSALGCFAIEKNKIFQQFVLN